MKKTFDDFLRRKSSFKSSNLKPLLDLALSRLSVLRNQRLSRRSNARSDVVQLLTLPQHHRALLRVEQVIKEDNMIDAFVMLEGYCFMILERMHLLEQQRECPEELDEAVSCLLYAASRCGEFPELQEIRSIFARRYGKEFAARAIELRNNCSVNRQMILKLSPRQPSLENRLKVLEEIAEENSVVLQIQEITDEKQVIDQKYDQPTKLEGRFVMNNSSDGSTEVERLSDSMKMGRRQYKDVVEAAQAAFESAAYAAVAARAAVELSKTGSHRYHSDDDDDDDDPGKHQTTRIFPINKDQNEIENKYEIIEVEDELKKEEIVEMTKEKDAPLEELRTNDRDIRFDESEEDESNTEESKMLIGQGTKEGTKDEDQTITVSRGRGSSEQDDCHMFVDSKEASDPSKKKMNSKSETKPTSVRTRRRRLWL